MGIVRVYACERKSACDKRLVKTVVNGYEREGGRVISRACLRERHLGRESVSMCERPPMESETTHKRLMYTLIKNINCIQILGWDHDISNSRKERSLIHQTSSFYEV